MGNYIASLLMKIGTDTGELERGLTKAKGNLNSFSNDATQIGLKFTKALSFVGVGVGIGGVMALAKSSMESVEGPGDRFAANMAGAKEGLFEFQRAIGSMDFSNLLTNLKEGFERGKELDEALDALEDRKGYSDYIIIGLQQEAEALRETTKNKGLELSVRANAANEIAKIEEKILKRKQEIIQETYDIEKLSWEGRNKMTIEEGVKLFESMNSIERDGYKDVSVETIKQIKELYDGTVRSHQIGGDSAAKAMKEAALLVKSNLAGYGNYDFIKNVPKEDLDYLVDTFQKFSTASETGESGVWVKLFETVNKNTKANVEAQKEYNGAVGETSKLITQDTKLENKKTQELRTQKELMDAMNEGKSQSIFKASTSNIKLPTFGKGFSVPNSLAGTSNSQDTIDKAVELNTVLEQQTSQLEKLETIGNLAGDAMMNLGDAFVELAETGKMSVKGLVSATLAGIRQVLLAKFAESLANTITNALSPNPQNIATGGLWGLGVAAAGMIAVTALWNKLPEFANGTSYSPGGLALVGERGAEIVNLPQGSQVLPNIQSRNMLNGNLELTTRVNGSDLIFVLKNAERSINSYA